MKEVWWQVNKKQFTFDQLRSGHFSDRLTEFEKTTLDFGNAWISGITHFELHTSGSTGVPKTIKLHRDQMEASARLTETALGLKAGYTALNCLDTKRIAGKMMLVTRLLTSIILPAMRCGSRQFKAVYPAFRPRTISVSRALASI